MEPAPPALPQMPAASVVELCALLDAHGIACWLDGGWAVDALLGEQTRAHGDLDLVVLAADVPRLRALLGERGFADQPQSDTSAWNFVLADGAGLEVDVHVITLADDGRGIYGPAERGEFYPASSLTGAGSVLGRSVRCIAAADLVEFHRGYALDETDYRDVAALCARFGLALPPEYARFQTDSS